MLTVAHLGRLVTQWPLHSAVLSLDVRLTAVVPVHAALTCSGVVASVHDGVAQVLLTAVLDDGTVAAR